MEVAYLFTDCDYKEAAAGYEAVLERFREVVKDKKIIIYGASLIGNVLYHCLEYLQLSTAYIVDRDADRIGCVGGMTVCKPEDVFVGMPASGNEYIVFLAVSDKAAESVRKDLQKREIPCEVIHNGAHVTTCVQIAICEKRHRQNEDVSHAYCGDCSILDSICPVLRQRAIDETKSVPNEAKSANTVSIGYILGNICTLNCKFCFESVPMYGKNERRIVETDVVIKDIRRVAEASECITFVEFIGGEPFLHKGLPEIIGACLDIRNIAYVHVFTNGTVAPPPELLAALQNPRASVYVSNYTGFLTEEQAGKVEQTKKIFRDSGVLSIYGGEKKWFDMSNYGAHEDTEEELARRYADCQTHHCNRLHDGTLYVCPHHFAGTKLGKFEERNTIDIHALRDVELAAALEGFKQIPYATACKYCDMPYDAPVVMAGD